MKKLSFFIMLLCAVTCYGEIVSEVSFNPSRMGDYNYLKVADKATLVGGLETDYLNIRSNGTVTLKNSTSTSATFKVDKQIIGDPDENQTVEISFPNAAFEVGSAVYAVGGEGKFVSGEIEDRILSKNNLKQKAGALTGGSVTITGGTTGELYDGESINGFWLDGNLIPTPTSLKGKDCEMEWDERYPAGSSTSVKLLALKDCKTSSPSPDPEPDDGGLCDWATEEYCTSFTTETETVTYHSKTDYAYYGTCQGAMSAVNRCPSWLHLNANVHIHYKPQCVLSANCPEPPNNYTYTTGTITRLKPMANEGHCCKKGTLVNPADGTPDNLDYG